MKWTTSCATETSNVSSSYGSDSAAPWRMSTSGSRVRAAATNGSDGSSTAGWPTSDLPLPTLGAHLAANAFAARHGGFRGRLAPVDAALALGTAATLVALERSGRGSAEVYEHALRAGLGDDYS